MMTRVTRLVVVAALAACTSRPVPPPAPAPEPEWTRIPVMDGDDASVPPPPEAEDRSAASAPVPEPGRIYIETHVEQPAVLGVDAPGRFGAHSVTTLTVRRLRSTAPLTQPPCSTTVLM